MAFREAKEKTIHARALTKPQPRFVSIVSAGANQTPIKTVKVDIVAIEEISMTTKIAALKAEGHEVKKITFKKGDTFADEAAVRSFLDEGGYAFTDIDETDNGFVVENKLDDFTDDVREVEVDDDLTVHVGKLVTPDESSVDSDDAAKAQANKAGSAITKIEPIESKKDEPAADGTRSDKTLLVGVDGSAKPVRKRERKRGPDEATRRGNSMGLMYPKDEPVGGSDEVTDEEGVVDQAITEEGAKKALEETAQCGIDEVFMDGKCVKTTKVVEGQTFDLIWDKEVAKDMMVPLGSFVVPAEKVELVGGSCGNGHVAISVDGVMVCVPTGDRTPIENDKEVTAPAAGGGQNTAGFGGVSPAAGQTNRSEGDVKSIVEMISPSMPEVLKTKDGRNCYVFKGKDNTRFQGQSVHTESPVVATKEIAERFDEFSAHFSDGKTLGEVMDDANDGFPPGLEQVIFAAVMAMRNNFLSGDMGAVKQAGTDLGEVAAMLGGMFGENAEREALKGWIDDLSGQFENIGWLVAEEQPINSATKGQENKDTQDGTAPLAEALSGIASTMKTIADQLGEVKTEVTATKAATADLTDRVKVVEDRRQVRKGAAEGDVNDGSTVVPKVVSKLADITLKNQLGITT